MVQPHERKVVMKNVAFLSALQAITYLLPIIIVPYLFRVLGPDKFGLIAFAQAFVQYFVILTDYGFNVSATKEISLCRGEHSKVCTVFSSVMMVKLALAALSLLIIGSIVYFIPRFRNDWMVYILSFGTVVGSTIFPLWFFQGKEKMNYISNLNSIGGVLIAIFIFSFVKGPQDYLMVPLINSGVLLTTGFLGQYLVLRRFRVSFQLQRYKNFQQQLTAGWDIFISTAAINAYTTTRVFMLGLFTNNSTTGLYSIAEKIANACQTFPLNSFSQAIFPRLSKIFQRNKPKALKIMQHLQQITTIISLICLPLIFIFADGIVKLACGAAYTETVLSLRLLIISVFFITSNAFRVQFLLVCGKTDIFSRIHVSMAMIGIPLIVILINSFSYVGAAAATVVIEAGVFTITYLSVRKLTFSKKNKD
ncbi:MAG: flippase [Candidatus Omnitrophota bacterium]